MDTVGYRDLKIGIFVFSGLAVILVSIILMGADRSLFSSTYHLNIEFNEVQGLAPGSVVSLMGIPVGNVRKLSFGPQDSSLLVDVEIDKNFQNRITNTSKVSVKTQGALGDRFIYIEQGTPGSKPLQAGELLKAELSGDFMDILKEKGQQLEEFVLVARELRVLLSSLNGSDRTPKLIDAWAGAGEEMRATMRSVKGLVSDLEAGGIKDSLLHLNAIVKKIDQGEGTLGQLIKNRDLHDRILNTLGDTPRNNYLTPLLREAIRNQSPSK